MSARPGYRGADITGIIAFARDLVGPERWERMNEGERLGAIHAAWHYCFDMSFWGSS